MFLGRLFASVFRGFSSFISTRFGILRIPPQVQALIEDVAEEFAKARIQAAILEAIEEMSTMPVNEGQFTAFEVYVVEAFGKIDTNPERCQPEVVYFYIPAHILEFMGGIVSVGVEIVLEGLAEAIESLNITKVIA